MNASILELEKKCRLTNDQNACTGLAWAYLAACERESSPDSHACVSLGDLYAAGVGVPKIDENRSVDLYYRACKLGNTRGCFTSGMCFSNGIGVKTDLKRASEAFALACRKGHPTACHQLAKAYTSGKGVPKDRSKALYIFNLACEMGSTASCANAGSFYMNGIGGPKNEVLALKRLKHACQLGDQSSCGLLQKLSSKQDDEP